MAKGVGSLKIANTPSVSSPSLVQGGENEGIELLVKMAQSGEIDPWNVDIVKVADEYLKAVAELRESDLKKTGKTLLYLAILLRMKSDQLAGNDYLTADILDTSWDELEDAPGAPALMLIDPFQNRRPYHTLEEALKRRTSSKQPRIRPVTLEDLIQELQKYEAFERKRSLREKVEKAEQRRMTDYGQFTSDDIEELAHEEFLEDNVSVLGEMLDKILVQQITPLSFSHLSRKNPMDRISVFIALLFLESRGEIEMYQEEFYGELFIRKPEIPPEDSPEILNDAIIPKPPVDNTTGEGETIS